MSTSFIATNYYIIVHFWFVVVVVVRVFVSYFTVAVGYVSEEVFVYIRRHFWYAHRIPWATKSELAIVCQWNLFLSSFFSWFHGVFMCVCLFLSLSFVDCQIPTVFIVVVFLCVVCVLSMEITSMDYFRVWNFWVITVITCLSESQIACVWMQTQPE